MSATLDLKSWCDRLTKPYLHKSSGAVAVIVTPHGEFASSYGRIDAARPGPPDAATLFEIGSITKVFTAILLAEFSLDGRIDIDAPVGVIARDFAGAPAWITPRALATHTSGLPRIPFTTWQILKIGEQNPYAKFTRADLISWLQNYRPKGPPKPDAPPSYSNLGMGLLGELLAIVAGTTYETALGETILTPLGLTGTAITLNADQRARFATPHVRGSKETPPWDFDALAGAGALRATANDLAAFARAVIGASKGQGLLDQAIARTLHPEISAKNENVPDQCLGWVRLPADQHKVPTYFHDGGTLGTSSALYVVPDAGVAVVLLANQGLSLWRMIKIARARPDAIVSEIVNTQTGG